MQPNNPQRPTPARPRPQFFDVVRPGRTPASPNSRPVLASNQPPVQDTSMKKGAPAVPPGLLKVQQPASPPPAVPAPPKPTPTPRPIQPTPPQPQMRPAAPIMPAQQDVGKAAVDSQVAPEPIFEPRVTPQTQPDHNAQQKHGIWSEAIAVLAIILLIATIVNILLDADILSLPLPHTNFFDY